MRYTAQIGRADVTFYRGFRREIFRSISDSPRSFGKSEGAIAADDKVTIFKAIVKVGGLMFHRTGACPGQIYGHIEGCV